MYREYREMTRADAVESLYQDMAARHRARFRTIHILKVVEVEKTEDIRRPYIKQLLAKDLKFPLPHRNPPEEGRQEGLLCHPPLYLLLDVSSFLGKVLMRPLLRYAGWLGLQNVFTSRIWITVR